MVLAQVSLEVAVKMLAGVQSSEGLIGAGSSASPWLTLLALSRSSLKRPAVCVVT